MASVAKRKWTYQGKERAAWVVRYVDRLGARRSETFKTMKEADRRRIAIEAELATGTHIARGEAETVAEVAEAYLADLDRKKKAKEIGHGWYLMLRRSVERFVIPLLGSRRFNDLAWTDAQAYLTHLRGSGMSPIVAKRHLRFAAQVEALARQRGSASKQTLSDACAMTKPAARTGRATFSEDQVRAILLAYETRPKLMRIRGHARARCIVNIAACCGLRFGEIAGLTRENVDLDGGLLRVRNALTHWDELKGPKSRAGIRNFPMPRHVVQMLRDWIGEHYVPNKRELIFRGPRDGKLESGEFHEHQWRPFLAAAGVPEADDRGKRYTFHAFRHFTTSYLIDAGVPPADVSKLIGHSKVSTTLSIYAHSIRDTGSHRATVEEVAARLGATRAPQPRLTH